MGVEVFSKSGSYIIYRCDFLVGNLGNREVFFYSLVGNKDFVNWYYGRWLEYKDIREEDLCYMVKRRFYL